MSAAVPISIRHYSPARTNRIAALILVISWYVQLLDYSVTRSVIAYVDDLIPS
jgi:hypothetical protein